MTARRRAARLVVLGAGLCACGTLKTGSRFSEQDAAAALPFIVAGTTTREDMLLNLGPPWRSFDGDSIFAWRVARTRSASPGDPSSAGAFGPAPVCQTAALPMGGWNAFSLIVVFDGDVVRRFSLVRVR